jgi:transcriptional antiterminator RfaH
VTQSCWHVVQSHFHSEAKAQIHLARQGFETYLPRYLKRRRHARRVDVVGAPLYPGYLFVAFDPAVAQWRSIRSTVGVTRLLCNGELPRTIDGSIIDGLRNREDEQGFIQLAQRSRFAGGDKVRVRDGIFSDCLGLFENMTDRERVVILLDLLGRKVRVTLDEEFIAAA